MISFCERDTNAELSSQTGTFYKSDMFFGFGVFSVGVGNIKEGRISNNDLGPLAPIPSSITSEAPHIARNVYD